MADLKKKVRKGAGKVSFLAHLDGIKKMLDAGYPMISVFEEYENKLSIKSGQFGKYVRKYVKGTVKKEKSASVSKPRKADREGFIMDTKLNQEDLL